MDNVHRLIHSRMIRPANNDKSYGMMEQYCSEEAKVKGHRKPYSAGPISIPKLSARKKDSNGSKRSENKEAD